MLGLAALGEFALGPISTAVTTAITASPASLTAAGQAATFQTTVTAPGGSYSVAGNAAVLTPAATAAAGSFTVSGQAATFRTTFTALAGSYSVTGSTAVFTTAVTFASGSYALSGQDISFHATIAGAAGSYSLNGDLDDRGSGILGGALGQFALGQGSQRAPGLLFNIGLISAPGSYIVTGIEANLSSEFLGGGGTIVVHHAGDELRSGTPFSKKRYRAIVETAAAQERAEERAQEYKRKAARDAALAAAGQAKAAIDAARLAEDRSNAADANTRALGDALRAMAGAHGTADAMRHSQAVMALALAAKAEQNTRDEEEAIALLLAA
jgi:hypothetical protein